MATTTRRVVLGDSIVLEVDIKDAAGNRVDADAIPEVSIIDPLDNVVRAASATDVIRTQLGRYRFTYTVPSSATTGVWIDSWSATVGGLPA